MYRNTVLLAAMLPFAMHATFSPYQFVAGTLVSQFLLQNTTTIVRIFCLEPMIALRDAEDAPEEILNERLLHLQQMPDVSDHDISRVQFKHMIRYPRGINAFELGNTIYLRNFDKADAEYRENPPKIIERIRYMILAHEMGHWYNGGTINQILTLNVALCICGGLAHGIAADWLYRRITPDGDVSERDNALAKAYATASTVIMQLVAWHLYCLYEEAQADAFAGKQARDTDDIDALIWFHTPEYESHPSLWWYVKHALQGDPHPHPEHRAQILQAYSPHNDACAPA